MPACKERWVLMGLILFLTLVFLHPLLLETFGKDHPDNCPFCAHYSNGGFFITAFSFLPFFIFLGYFLAIPSQKLASRFFLVSSGRAPPTIF
ncbi:MAG: hypothetical protein L0Z48_02705 [candidate division Zixibacteria bacterium]|nr:hypothetical protein [candidate division Zixibacteria bacterium]MCI0595434.1 hypothetical protein [candidate division Zixibacteria bacterium]